MHDITKFTFGNEKILCKKTERKRKIKTKTNKQTKGIEFSMLYFCPNQLDLMTPFTHFPYSIR